MKRISGTSGGLGLIHIVCLLVTCVALYYLLSGFANGGYCRLVIDTQQSQANVQQRQFDINQQLSLSAEKISEYLGSTSVVNGRVHKQGNVPVDLFGTGKEFESQRNAALINWSTKHELNQDPIGDNEVIFPVQCALRINHQYKLIYVRQFKSSSSSVLHYFGYCKTNKPACLAHVDGIPDDELRRLWNEYTVFTFVRNPYARAASAYTFLNNVARESLRPGVAKKSHCQVSFKQFCSNPRVLGHHCRLFPECCAERNPTFGIMRHVDPAYRCMVTDQGKWAVDFVGRAEHMDEDMKKLIDLINERKPADLEPLTFKHIEESNVQTCDGKSRVYARKGQLQGTRGQTLDSDPQLCKSQDKYAHLYVEEPTCFKELERFYREDFKHLGFAKVGQPLEQADRITDS